MTSRHLLTDCEKFEELLDKTGISEEELNFYLEHEQICPLRIHTREALQHRHYQESRPDFIARLRDVLQQPVVRSRRQMLRLVGMTATASILSTRSRSLHWLASSIFRKYREFTNRIRPRPTRLEVMSALLKPLGDIAYSAAKSHLGFESGPVAEQWKQSGFPHDSAAIAAFRRLDPTKPTLVYADSRESVVLPNASIVAAGSPVSSDDARLYLAYRNLNSSRDVIISDTFRPEMLPYHFVIGNEKTIKVRSGMMGGTWALKLAHSLEITRNGKLWQPRRYIGSQQKLSTDFLLVSRLPRSRSGGDVVLISGAHGAGVEAFALLFDEKAFSARELSALHDALPGARYFQFVLECSEISHDEEMSVAHKLSICEDCPPQIVEFSPDLFKDE